MRKIGQMTPEQLKQFCKVERKQKFLVNMGVLFTERYASGDSACLIDDTQIGEIYVNVVSGKERFYVVTGHILMDVCNCITLYPAN